MKIHDGQKVGHLHSRHTVSRYAVRSSDKHSTARCWMIKTEEWQLKSTTSSILLPHEEGVGLLRGAHGTGAGPRCLWEVDFTKESRNGKACEISIHSRHDT